MEQALQQAQERYRQNPDMARQLMRVGEASWQQQLDPMELAAFTAVANALLSLDETITKN